MALNSIENVQRVKCFGHRLNTLMEHMDSCAEYKAALDPVCDVLTKVKSSQKNLEELQRIQINRIEESKRLNEHVRGDVVKLPKNTPRTRWGYDYNVLSRAVAIFSDIYAMDYETNMYFKDPATKLKYIENLQLWRAHQCILDLLLELLKRVQFYIVKTQSGCSPTFSLILYAIADMENLACSILKKIDDIKTNPTCNKAMMNQLIVIIDYFKQQLAEVFRGFKDWQVLHCAQLFDVRVFNKQEYNPEYKAPTAMISSPNVDDAPVTAPLFLKKIVWNSLQVAKEMYSTQFLQQLATPAAVADVDYEEEGLPGAIPVNHNFENQWSSEVSKFASAIKKYVSTIDMEDQLNLDPLVFYKIHGSQFPMVTQIALLILAIPGQSAASQRVYSTLTYIVSKYRCRLDGIRAAGLIKSAHRYKHAKRTKSISGIKFPPFGHISSNYSYIDWDLLADDGDEGDEDYNPEEELVDSSSDDDDEYDNEDLNEYRSPRAASRGNRQDYGLMANGRASSSTIV